MSCHADPVNSPRNCSTRVNPTRMHLGNPYREILSKYQISCNSENCWVPIGLTPALAKTAWPSYRIIKRNSLRKTASAPGRDRKMLRVSCGDGSQRRTVVPSAPRDHPVRSTDTARRQESRARIIDRVKVVIASIRMTVRVEQTLPARMLGRIVRTGTGAGTRLVCRWEEADTHRILNAARR